MENQTKEQNLQTKQTNYWSASEQANLAKTLTVLINGQKPYGKEYSVTDTFDYFKMKLDGRFSMAQVIYAIGKYTDTRNDIPTPADIIQILNPAKPRITEAQFVEAQKWQERNGYPMFSDAKDIIDSYKEQEREVHQTFKIECERVQQLVSSTIKRIA